MLPRPPRCFLRPVLLLGLLLLGTAPLAQAQVVIKERVEIGTPGPKTLLSPQERARFFGLHTAGKTAAANTIVIPKDGTLRIVYGAAERLGVPYLRPSAELLITHNGVPAKNLALGSTFQSAVDTVFAHPWQSDPIFPVFCFGSSIDRYGYGADTQVDTFYTATAEAIVLEVEQGDELSFLFEATDFGQVYGDDPGEGAVFLDESTPPGVVRWLGGLGRFEASCPWATDLLLFDIEYAVTLAFLRQDDTEIPTEDKAPDEAVLMVSKLPPDVNLEEQVGFESTFTGADADPDTFRPQVTGIQEGSDVRFRVQVVREGQVEYEHEFEAVFGMLPEDEKPAYRGAKHLRLVSNARPPELVPFPEVAQYDDEYLEEQTILVKLGDTIRATVLVDGNVADSTTLPVGRPASENGFKAIRIGYINFIELSGLSPSLPPQPETTVDRINEDWAQVAIRFDLAGASTIDPVANVITVKNRTGTASADGTASVTVAPGQGTPTPVMINIFAGDTEEQIAQRLASEISNTVPGVTAQHYPHRTQKEDFWFVLVDKGNNVTFSNISSDPADVFIQPPALNYRDKDKIDLLAGNVLGLNFKDDDARTIDMFAIPNGTLPGAYGRAGFDLYQSTIPGWQNTILIIESAVNGNDVSNPLTAGHEIGHVLFNGRFPGSDPEDFGHSPDPQNLMSVGSQGGELEDFREGKRLTNEQNEDARNDSATPTPVPLLHQTGHNE